MASQGPNNPASGGTNSGVGTQDWNDSTGQFGSGGSVAYIQVDPDPISSYYLMSTNFGFSIPTGATIDGIVVEYTPSQSSAGTADDQSVKLVIGGSVTGTDKANTNSYPSYPNTSSYQSRGGSTDLWGTTPTYTQVNASDFGVAIAVESTDNFGSAFIAIDHVRMTVYYTEAAAGSNPKGPLSNPLMGPLGGPIG